MNRDALSPPFIGPETASSDHPPGPSGAIGNINILYIVVEPYTGHNSPMYMLFHYGPLGGPYTVRVPG